MKRTVFFMFFVLCLGIAGTGFVHAQENTSESEYYPVTYPVHRVYKYRDAYKVEFVQDDYTLNSFWVRYDWITGTDRIGTLHYGKADKGYPAVTLYYKNGELDFFRLYLIENRSDLSWAPRLDYTHDLDEVPGPDGKPEIVF